MSSLQEISAQLLLDAAADDGVEAQEKVHVISNRLQLLLRRVQAELQRLVRNGRRNGCSSAGSTCPSVCFRKWAAANQKQLGAGAGPAARTCRRLLLQQPEGKFSHSSSLNCPSVVMVTCVGVSPAGQRVRTPPRGAPSSPGPCMRRSRCSCCSCCCWSWPAWCRCPRTTTAAPWPTTTPAPSTPPCTTPTGPRPREPGKACDLRGRGGGRCPAGAAADPGGFLLFLVV